MKGGTLNNIVSKCWKGILKLKGQDNFQNLQGFIQVLAKEGQAQCLETLEEVIQCLLIFDDTMDKRSMDQWTKMNNSQYNATMCNLGGSST